VGDSPDDKSPVPGSSAAVGVPVRLSLTDRALMSVVSAIAWFFLRALAASWRWRVVGREHYDGLVAAGRPLIFSLWHDNILASMLWHRGEGIRPMVSHHRDGEMVARTLVRLGYAPIRGSSSRGGNAAFHEMVSQLQAGQHCAIMPDGPRGPRHHFKQGPILISCRSRAPLLPLTFHAHPMKVFRSWDRLKLPLPFARVLLRYGEPIEPPDESDPERIEALRLSAEAAMNELDVVAAADLRAWRERAV